MGVCVCAVGASPLLPYPRDHGQHNFYQRVGRVERLLKLLKKNKHVRAENDGAAGICLMVGGRGREEGGGADTRAKYL